MSFIHLGYKDLSPKDGNLDSVNVEIVANEIIDVGKTCNKYGVSDVFIPSLVSNRNYRKQALINELNARLKVMCENVGFVFITHDQIRREHLWKDGMHFQESGKILLANNYIYFLNNFLNKAPSVLPHR